jgi:hypothetical protein
MINESWYYATAPDSYSTHSGHCERAVKTRERAVRLVYWDAVFAPDRERATVRESEPFSELSRVARLKSTLDPSLARRRRCL